MSQLVFIKYCQPGGSEITRRPSGRCSLILIILAIRDDQLKILSCFDYAQNFNSELGLCTSKY